MTISCHLRVLLAKANVERAKRGEATLSLRQLADESHVSLSVLSALHTGKSQRVDYGTVDRLLNYFNRYFKVTINDLLVWEQTDAIQNEIIKNRGIPIGAWYVVL